MTLQKKQVYLNRVLSKHYKKLKYTLFNKSKSVPALKTTAIGGAQSIGISVLTIDTIRYKDFPNIIDVTFLNGLKKTKKAVVIYEGKTTVPTTFTRSINKLAQKRSKIQKPEVPLSNRHFLKPAGKNPKVFKGLGKFGIIDNILGAGICMRNYTLHFNSQLSLQHFNFLKRKQTIKLKNLDRLAASLILPEKIVKAKHSEAKNQEALKIKEVRLSKMELSSVIAQVLYKIHSFRGQESLGESVFNIKKLSNILGALVEINSKIYYISDKELKQCGLAGGLQHSALSSSTGGSPSLLKDLIHSKMIKDKEVLLKTKCIEPNIVFFNLLNIAARTYVIHNIKRIFSKLINILSLLVLPKPALGKREATVKSRHNIL